MILKLLIQHVLFIVQKKKTAYLAKKIGLKIWFVVGIESKVRGPESTFHVPYKVIIRVQQLVLLAQASIGWHHCRTRNPIGPRNWSTVMWPAPIGWWRRVSPAIYTTRAQDLGSVSRSLVFGHFAEHTLVYRWYGTLQVAAPAVRDLQ